jgi:hypothetical protein
MQNKASKLMVLGALFVGVPATVTLGFIAIGALFGGAAGALVIDGGSLSSLLMLAFGLAGWMGIGSYWLAIARITANKISVLERRFCLAGLTAGIAAGLSGVFFLFSNMAVSILPYLILLPVLVACHIVFLLWSLNADQDEAQ